MTRKLNTPKLTSDEAVNKLRASLERSRVRCEKWRIVSAVGFLLCIAAIFIAGFVHQDRSLVYYEGLLWIFTTIATVCTVPVLESRKDRIKEVLSELRPLSETASCVEALALCQQSERARRVRDAALREGRQLYAFDYTEMVAQSSLEREDKGRAVQLEACKALHQLA